MTTTEKVNTTIQRVIKLEDVPQKKFSHMMGRTLIGIMFIGLGVEGMAKFNFPWWAGLLCVLVGASTWSTQIVVGTLKALVSPFKDFLGAWRGKDGKEDADA